MAKNKSKKGKRSSKNCYTREDFKVRIVTKDDKWCRKAKQRMIKGRLTPVTIDPKAPQGYLVTIPSAINCNNMLLNLDGVIIKSRLYNGDLLLQVQPTGKHKPRIYKIVVKTTEVKKTRTSRTYTQFKKKVYRRFINICNMDKVQYFEQFYDCL
ncbi:MAG: hypothetical protein Q4D02_00025 [Clostridia bacterium]|nr:hypothetical protein [Clostridia bacterium]